ncbi:MAG TPA: hypothetical protein PLV61_08550, partial [Parvularculaceae bacterium]|nr:hypothetical protein [Parvularculaceae bacterium]
MLKRLLSKQSLFAASVVFGLFAAAMFALVIETVSKRPSENHEEIAETPAGSMTALDTKMIKPVIERRCVVCHGCYDAPCQ